MNRQLAMVALLAACSTPAMAGDTDDPLAALARESGLTERQYRMLAGPSTSYAEYRTSYGYLRHQLQRAALREAREAEAREAAEAAATPDAGVEARDAGVETYAVPDER